MDGLAFRISSGLVLSVRLSPFAGCSPVIGSRSKIQQLEHRHDRDERSRERVNSLRRDAGVKLAASLPPVPGALTALTIGGPDELRDHRLSEFYAASALYVLAGSPETVSLVQGHANRVRDLATDIVTRLAPAHEDYGRHVAADGVYKGAASNVERVLSELFKLAESGAGGEDPRVVGLQGSLDHFERQAKEYQSTRDQALRAYRLKAAAVREAMSDEVKELRRAIPRIVAAIRHDLELPGPMDAFIATHDEATDRRWIKATAAIRLFDPAPVESGGESDARSSAPRASTATRCPRGRSASATARARDALPGNRERSQSRGTRGARRRPLGVTIQLRRRRLVKTRVQSRVARATPKDVAKRDALERAAAALRLLSPADARHLTASLAVEDDFNLETYYALIRSLRSRSL